MKNNSIGFLLGHITRWIYVIYKSRMKWTWHHSQVFLFHEASSITDSKWYSFNYYLYTVEQSAWGTWLSCSYGCDKPSHQSHGPETPRGPTTRRPIGHRNGAQIAAPGSNSQRGDRSIQKYSIAFVMQDSCGKIALIQHNQNYMAVELSWEAIARIDIDPNRHQVAMS